MRLAPGGRAPRCRVQAGSAQRLVGCTLEPGRYLGLQSRQAARQRQRRQEDFGRKAAVVFIQHRALQLLQRTNARKHPALADTGALGDLAQRQLADAFRRGHFHGGVEDGGERRFAFCGQGVHGSNFSTHVRNIKPKYFLIFFD
jgi:hypothetical protein